MPPPYSVCYCDFERGREVAPDGRLSMDAAEVTRLMESILDSPGSFVSVRDDEGSLLQFIVDDDGMVCIDMPAPRERGSYGKRCTLESCKSALEAMNGRIRRDVLEGLEFVRW